MQVYGLRSHEYSPSKNNINTSICEIKQNNKIGDTVAFGMISAQADVETTNLINRVIPELRKNGGVLINEYKHFARRFLGRKMISKPMKRVTINLENDKDISLLTESFNKRGKFELQQTIKIEGGFIIMQKGAEDPASIKFLTSDKAAKLNETARYNLNYGAFGIIN